MTVTSYTTPGTYYWLCPAGLDHIDLEMRSGGGGGGGGASDSNSLGEGGSESTIVTQSLIAVTPGVTYTLIVGNGGTGGQGGVTGVSRTSGSDGGVSSAFGYSSPEGGGGADTSTYPNNGQGLTGGAGAQSGNGSPGTNGCGGGGGGSASYGVVGNGGAGGAGYVKITYNLPVPGFTGTPLVGPKPLTVAFTDSSSGVVTGRSWDFGDSETSTDTNPSHEYHTAGYKTVILACANSYGSAAMTRVAYVNVTRRPRNFVTIITCDNIRGK